MATLERVATLVATLVDEGRIYFGQPSARMAGILAGAASRWRTKCPGDVASYPWGRGSNEDLPSLVASAQVLLYGAPDLTAEFVAGFSNREREYFDRVTTLTRGKHSPFAVATPTLWAWLSARRLAGLPDYLTEFTAVGSLRARDRSERPIDGRDLHGAVTTWEALRPHSATIEECERAGKFGYDGFGEPAGLTGRTLVDYALRAAAATGRLHHLRYSPIDLGTADMVRAAALPFRQGVAAMTWYGLTACWSAAVELAVQDDRAGQDAGQAGCAAFLRSPQHELDAQGSVWMGLVSAYAPGLVSTAAPHLDGPGVTGYRLAARFIPRLVLEAPEQQTIEAIRSEGNPEIRRLRIERFAGAERPTIDGWRRYLAELDPTVMDDRRNDVEGTRELLLDCGKDRVLLCTCRTGRIFALPVPTTVETCADAQAFLGGDGACPLPKTNIIGRS